MNTVGILKIQTVCITILLHSNCILQLLLLLLSRSKIACKSHLIYFFRSMSTEILSMVRAQGVGHREIEF